MKCLSIKKVRDGKYLKNYELTYLNKQGREKIYEIVSRQDIAGVEELGSRPSGLSLMATCDDRLLLLKEFRMGVNKKIYNLCAGMLEADETVEECIRRELYEETGLSLKRIIKVLPPSYSAVAISDLTTYMAFVEVEGELSNAHTSDNEEIEAGLYTKEEVEELLRTQEFSSRAQLAAYYFCCMR